MMGNIIWNDFILFVFLLFNFSVGNNNMAFLYALDKKMKIDGFLFAKNTASPAGTMVASFYFL